MAPAAERVVRPPEGQVERVTCPMSDLAISATRAFDSEMDRLRQVCFPGPVPVESSRDQFDARSIYPVVRIDGQIAAYGRLTAGPNAVFETWTGGAADIPTGPEVADLGRCLVAPVHRGLDLITLVCLEGLLLAAELGFKQVVGAVIPGRKLAAMLYEIGFRDSGSVVTEQEPNGNTIAIQPLVACCSQVDLWAVARSRVLQQLAEKGYRLSESGQRSQAEPTAAADRGRR